MHKIPKVLLKIHSPIQMARKLLVCQKFRVLLGGKNEQFRLAVCQHRITTEYQIVKISVHLWPRDPFVLFTCSMSASLVAFPFKRKIDFHWIDTIGVIMCFCLLSCFLHRIYAFAKIAYLIRIHANILIAFQFEFECLFAANKVENACVLILLKCK